jgi:hypothetical protein
VSQHCAVRPRVSARRQEGGDERRRCGPALADMLVERVCKGAAATRECANPGCDRRQAGLREGGERGDGTIGVRGMRAQGAAKRTPGLEAEDHTSSYVGR